MKTGKRATLRLILTLSLVIAALTVIDKALERTQSADLKASARDAYASGLRLVKAGRASDGVELLRNAHALQRDNRDYELQLIAALLQTGKTAEAGPLMDDALEADPNDGRTNLAAARLSAAKGDAEAAASYFHRAIYGDWGSTRAADRTAARLELIDFLERKGSRQELLAETISLEAEAPRDPAIRARLGRLFLRAGAPSRAAEVYRALVAQAPGDPANYAGVGEAELEQGAYRPARAAFTRAFFLNPNDASIRARLHLLNTVAALDPTPRQLPSREKYLRSVRVLELARRSLEGCLAKNAPGRGNESARSLRPDAGMVTAKASPAMTNEAAEKALGMAEEIWRARVGACREEPAAEEPLRLIMQRLAG